MHNMVIFKGTSGLACQHILLERQPMSVCKLDEAGEDPMGRSNQAHLGDDRGLKLFLLDGWMVSDEAVVG